MAIYPQRYKIIRNEKSRWFSDINSLNLDRAPMRARLRIGSLCSARTKGPEIAPELVAGAEVSFSFQLAAMVCIGR